MAVRNETMSCTNYDKKSITGNNLRNRYVKKWQARCVASRGLPRLYPELT